jgi:hypothetical protein
MTTSFTLAQYKSWVRGRLPGLTLADALLTDIADSVNKELCLAAEWPFLERTYTGTAASGYREFDLQASISTLLVPMGLQLISPDSYAIYPEYKSWRQLYREYPDPDQLSASRPWLWSVFGSTLILGPAKTDQIYTFRLPYVIEPSSITTDSQTLDIPDAFKEVVIVAMMIRALKSKNKYNQAQVLQQDFDGGDPDGGSGLLGQMKKRLLVRQTSEPPRINTGRTNPRYRDPFDA